MNTKIKWLRDKINGLNMQGMIVSNPINVRYLTGIDAEGRQHDALFDARNTAVLFKTVRIPDLYKTALEKVVNVLQAKSISTSLGDIFDFSQLELTA